MYEEEPINFNCNLLWIYGREYEITKVASRDIYFMVSIFRMYCKFTSKLVTFANNKMISGIAVAPYIIS